MYVDIFKDATSKLTSNIIPNMRVFILVFAITLMICCFVGVIYVEHLVFYRLFQLINNSNKPIPVNSYQYDQCNMYTSVHAALHAQPFFAGLVWNMNINSYKATEMIMEALNTFFCSQPQSLNRYMWVLYIDLSVHLSVRLYVTLLCLWPIFQMPDSIIRLIHKTLHLCGWTCRINEYFKAMSKQAVIGYMYRMHICSIFYACPSSDIQQSW